MRCTLFRLNLKKIFQFFSLPTSTSSHKSEEKSEKQRKKKMRIFLQFQFYPRSMCQVLSHFVHFLLVNLQFHGFTLFGCLTQHWVAGWCGFGGCCEMEKWRTQDNSSRKQNSTWKFSKKLFFVVSDGCGTCFKWWISFKESFYWFNEFWFMPHFFWF